MKIIVIYKYILLYKMENFYIFLLLKKIIAIFFVLNSIKCLDNQKDDFIYEKNVHKV